MSADKSVTYTLRLSDVWKSRLERSAKFREMSVNQLIMEIVAQHYKTAGYFDADSIELKNGRRLNVRVKPANHPPGTPTCWFHLTDPEGDREVAGYRIGASNQLMQHFKVSEKEQYDVIAELGMALLSYHDERGTNIAKLEWKQFPTAPEMRILDTNDMKTAGRTHIFSQPDFHEALVQKQWQDRHLKPVLKPVLSKEIALALEKEARSLYDTHMASLDAESASLISSEKEAVLNMIRNMVPEGLENLGLHDPLLNENEVHFFAQRWKADHPELESNRVIGEIGKGTADRAIATFVYEYSHFFLDPGEPFVCRWIVNGEEKSRQLITK